MRTLRFTLAAALLAAAGACTRTDGLTAPPQAERDVLPPSTPDHPPADSTGDWGGALGSGT